MKFITPKDAASSRNLPRKLPRTTPSIGWTTNQIVISIPPIEMRRMGWTEGTRFAVGYDAARCAIGLVPDAGGYKATCCKAMRSAQVRLSAGSCNLAGIPTTKAKTADAPVISREDGVLLIADPRRVGEPAALAAE